MPHAEVTRLLRLSTGVLEEYAIDSMPPYIAVSHAWADGLFNSGTAFSETIGGQALLGSINNSVNPLQELDHCWVDTFCIDQASEVDKHRQIPLMGSIFSEAVSLAVMLPYDLQFTQADVDRLGEALEPAFKLVEDHDWSSKQARWCREEPIKSLLIRALYGLSHLVKGSWATRVWTAKEFLLAKAVMWIGTDHSMIRVHDSQFDAIMALVDEHLPLGQSAILRRLNVCMWPVLLFRLNDIDRTRFITQISDRECSVPQDIIYGAMAASGVCITVTQSQRAEDVWRLWWETAIKRQHVRWACCAIIWKTPGVPPLLPNYNCMMPPFEVRRIASGVFGFDRVEPLGPVELKDGTVSLYGYDVGVCKIVAHLGHYHRCLTRDGSLILEPNLTIVLWSQGNLKHAFRIATALGAGYFKIRNLLLVAQVLTCNYSKALWAVKHNRQDSFTLIFRSYEQHRIYADFTRVRGHQVVSVARASFEVYLATISNTITTTDVAILLPGKAPQGQLRALDFNIIHGSDEFDPKFLTIVESPTIPTAPNIRYTPEFDTLHKVGVTLPVNFFYLDMYGQHDFEGGEPQLFHIGGDSCTICRFEKPERAPDTLTSDIGLYTGPEPLCIPNIQIKPRVRASPFDPRRTRRPNGMVSVKYLERHMVRTQWYEYDNSPLRQYPRPRRRRATKESPDKNSYNDYTRAKLRPTEANKKYPSSITAAELRMAQEEHRKKSKSSG